MEWNKRALYDNILRGQVTSEKLFNNNNKKAFSANKMFLIAGIHSVVLTEIGCLAFCIDLNGSICVNIYLVKYIELYRI